MNDTDIINLYFARSQSAIEATAAKYGAYLHTIAYNILGDVRDTEEVLTDTYFALWNAIPPARPRVLKHYLSRVVRNLSFDKLDYRNAEKRNPNMTAVLEELDACVPDRRKGPEEVWEQKELIAALNGFLGTLSKADCALFVCRYYHSMPLKDIARRQRMPERTVKYRLQRLRRQLNTYLTKEDLL